MPFTRSQLPRLAVIRYLFESGAEQSRRPGPLSGLALLALHDATELFLQVALEHKGGTLSGDKGFQSYWSAMEQTGIKLPHKEAMKRFNNARVAIKHYGTLPVHAHVEEFRIMVGAFLEDSFRLVFEEAFADVSLSGFVNAEAVRTRLLDAEEALRSKKYAKVVEYAAIAFNRALDDYARGADDGTWQQVRPGLDMSNISSNLQQLGSEGRSIASALRDMADKFSEQVTVIAYRLDFDGYRCLKSYSPIIYSFANGNTQAHWNGGASKITEEIASRCLEFAIDAALRLEGRLS